MPRKAPMTEAEARENVAEMKAHTAESVQARLIELALGGLGNLSIEARRVYRARLVELSR